MAYISFQPNDYFNTKIYTGTGSSNALTGVGFQPDWTWIKVRSEANNHEIYDAVRGVTKRIYSDLTNAEDTNTAGLTAFGTDGFTVNTGGGVNGSSKTYVAWNWKANGSGSANTDGSINSTVSANTTSGFSIVKWVGTGANATIGHGLGVAPSLLISKNYGTATNWYVYHKSLGATKNVRLNLANASATETAVWNDTAPTNSVFSVGTNTSVNNSGDNTITYCFAEKKGFSKFGSYIGNNSFDGTFVYTGFKPALVIVKHYLADSRNWVLLDNKRSSVGGSNPNDKWLYANENEVEANQASNPTDFLSNGFKLRSNAGYTNNGSYIYMAFAEEPLVSSNGIPAVAE